MKRNLIWSAISPVWSDSTSTISGTMVHLFEFYGPFIFGCVLLLDVLRLKNYKQPIGLVGSCLFLRVKQTYSGLCRFGWSRILTKPNLLYIGVNLEKRLSYSSMFLDSGSTSLRMGINEKYSWVNEACTPSSLRFKYISNRFSLMKF